MWASPLSSTNCGPRQKRVQETHCTTDGRVVQYAISASSSEPFQMSGFWGPEQAAGTSLFFQLISLLFNLITVDMFYLKSSQIKSIFFKLRKNIKFAEPPLGRIIFTP